MLGGTAPKEQDILDTLRHVSLSCPRCTGRLDYSHFSISCRTCRMNYPIIDGVPDFESHDQYYGELPRHVMRTLLNEIPELGWKKTVHKYLAEQSPWAYQIIMDETRADWQFLLSLGSTHLVLDIGSGWGTISVPLARRCRQVVAMDSTLERCLFVRLRCIEEGVSNVLPVRADILEAPLGEDQFDLVIFNGSLEWVGESNPIGSPRLLQLEALQKAYRLCKKDALVYIGIENKYGFKYLLGFPDDHTGIKNITFLPRSEADKLSTSVRGKPYRTYTHSYDEYRRLLQEAGFRDIAFYYPLPDYKSAMYVAPLDDDYKTPMNFLLTHLYSPYDLATSHWHNQMDTNFWQTVTALERAAVDLRLLRYFAASFSIVAKKD